MQSARPALLQTEVFFAGPLIFFILKLSGCVPSYAAIAAAMTAINSKDIFLPPCSYSGIFPCFFAGSDSRFEASISKALMIMGLVFAGSIISST